MIDEARFVVKAGNGGDGAVSFRREKYAPKGGPDGGDGGNGGSVWLMAQKGINTLSFFSGKDRFEASAGGKGSKRKRHGENADDVILLVPVGTMVYELAQENRDEGQGASEEHVLLFDLIDDGQRVCLAKGGIGGRGNWHFRSSTNTTPQEYEAGTKGEQRSVKLELKVLAHVGLVGLPNAGKSTLLSILTKAQPKIANYPFTTLSPNLGAMELPGKSDHLIVADIPGLIEGASEGKGLGIQFLKHVERCRMLVYVVGIDPGIVDLTDSKSLFESLMGEYQQVKNEVSEYKADLTLLPSIILINKSDLLNPEISKEIVHAFTKKGLFALSVSAITGLGIDALRKKLMYDFENASTSD